MSDVTRILEAAQQGDSIAADQLLPLVYEELRKLAAHRMANEAAGQTLQPTALVHEAWLRLVGDDGQARFQNRAHFFAAAEAMRRILIDRARRKRAVRHGGQQQRVELEEIDLTSPDDDDQLLALNEALDKLAVEHKAEAELVKLRYFVGMTNDEAAEAPASPRAPPSITGRTPARGCSARSSLKVPADNADACTEGLAVSRRQRHALQCVVTTTTRPANRRAREPH